MDSYSDVFFRLTGNQPFPYQLRYREEPAPATILSVPTGLGKTDAVLVDWLYRRPTTRLVYCLPGRALTKQVAAIARKYRDASDPKIKVLELMGGSGDNDLTLSPADRAILIGTQDLLISRALNRGYARTPFRWPIDFALLNNDACWIYDEVQLLGDAVATSAQLSGFREQLGTFGTVPSVWMSATFDPSWLETIDFRDKPRVVELESDDKAIPEVQKRLEAPKTVSTAPEECRTPRGCAEFVKQEHQPEKLSLIIANTVARARSIWEALKKLDVKEPVLLHSRFRPGDRARGLDRVLAQGKGIVVSTQVIEAGINLDADLLVTDIAPWPSLVQRFGRVNRFGLERQSRIFWVDRPGTSGPKSKDEGAIFAPYELHAVHKAIEILHSVKSGSPADLPEIAGKPPYKFVLRRSDLFDLFDTTPDLAGNHIDVSRFVRSGKDTDVYAAWREWPGQGAPSRTLRRISQQELCPVPINNDLRAFIEKHDGWTWRYTGRGDWEKVAERHLYPGMRILFRASAGGYDPKGGWLPTLTEVVPEVVAEQAVLNPDAHEEDHDSDQQSEGSRRTLTLHTDDVARELDGLLKALPNVGLTPYCEVLEIAARYHDWGKAHPIFQQTLHNLDNPPNNAPDELLAKQRKSASRQKGHSRKWFRHELGSALAMLNAGHPDLAAYVVAAHHGRVRVSIRSMPGELDRNSPGRRVARGIQEGDLLFPADLGNGVSAGETVLKLAATELGINESGMPGWSDRILRLMENEPGPFRLAFLEMLLRSADERASAVVNAAGYEIQ